MKTTSSLVCTAALMFALGAQAAHADSITVNVTGHVSSVFDSSNLLNGEIVASQPVTATYTYDLTVPDVLRGFPNIGWYPMTAAQAAVQVTVGSLVLQNASTSELEVSVHSHSPSGEESFIQVWSGYNVPLSPQVSVDSLLFSMSDPSGQFPATDSLPDYVPSVQQFPDRYIAIQGSTANGQWYSVNIEIDSMEIPVPEEE